MMTYRWLAGTAALLFLHPVAAAGAQGAADSPAAAQVTDVGEILVTARKRQERLQDVPLPISAFNGDELAARGVGDSKTLFDAVPNLNFARQGAYVPIPSIRGVFAAVQDPTSEPSVGFYIDDVYVPAANQLDMNLLEVERVEVLRGPQGTLYGRNSLGGAIRIVTRKPSREPTASGRLSYGNRDLVDAAFSVSGPIVADRLLGRIAAALRRSDGFLYNEILDRNVEFEDYKGAMLALRALPNDRLTLDLTADLMRSRPSSGNQETFETSVNETCRAAPVGVINPGCPAFAAGFGYSANTTPFDGIIARNIEAIQDQKGGGVSLTATYESAGFDIVSISGYRSYRAHFEEDRDGSPYPIIAPFFQDYESKSYSQELRLVSTGDGALRWVAGLYGYKDGRDLATVAGSPRPGIFTASPPPTLVRPLGPFPAGTRLALFNALLSEATDLDSTSKAVFGQATYDATPAISVTLGARYTWEKRDIRLLSSCDSFSCPALSVNLPDGTILTGALPGSGGPPRLLSSRRKEEVLTPLASISLKPTDDILVYATASKGFKSGGYAPVFTFSVRPFDSETAWNHEVGVKSTWLDGRLMLNLAGFFLDWKEVQLSSFSSSGGFVVQNAARVNNKGLEVELRGRPAGGLSLGSSYGYLDSRYDADLSAPCTPPAVTSQCSVHLSRRRTNTPTHSISAFAEYETPLDAQWTLALRADYALKTGILFRTDSIGTAGDPTAINTGRLLRRETYDTVNARIGVGSGSWGFALWARNLLDEDYYSSTREFAGIVNAAYGYRGEPRTYGVEASFRF